MTPVADSLIRDDQVNCRYVTFQARLDFTFDKESGQDSKHSLVVREKVSCEGEVSVPVPAPVPVPVPAPVSLSLSLSLSCMLEMRRLPCDRVIRHVC